MAGSKTPSFNISRRVVGSRVMPDQFKCMVRFRCVNVECQREALLDAYEGVPTCESGHLVAWMEPMSLVRRAQTGTRGAR